MKEKKGCPPKPTFYLVILAGIFLGFTIGGSISKNVFSKIIGAIVFGFIAAVLAADDTCYDEKGNAIILSESEPSSMLSMDGSKEFRFFPYQTSERK